MTNFPECLPAGTMCEVLPDIFFVTGQMISGKGEGQMRYSRNMTVVRDGNDLSIFNSVRLDEDGLKALEAFGTIQHVVRLGFNHGRDDAFYLNRYGAQFWAMDGMEFNRGETVNRHIVDGEPGPCGASSFFVFETATQPEAILHVKRNDGLLIACDSLQNLCGPDRFFNEVAIGIMRTNGFFRPANIGPGWLQKAEPKSDDFARLKRNEFHHVLSGHGEPCLEHAYEQYSATFSELMGVTS